MDFDTFPAHYSAKQGDPRGREAHRVAIHQAVRLIEIEHEVLETVAYTILVQASMDSNTSVREAASRIVADSRRTA